MKAYDVHLDDWQAGEPDRRAGGWCFGLPPGLMPEQWPLDPHLGQPMQHGFTLRLPEDYRVHGPEIVALSFFTVAADLCDGGPPDGPDGMEAAITGATPPEDAALRPYWERAQHAHPRLFRMADILGCGFAVVLLTQEEFEGPLCHPPALVASAFPDRQLLPAWLTYGGAYAYETAFCRRELPALAGDPFTTHRAFRWTPRATDPNAGKPPRETWDGQPTDGGYESYFYWQDGIAEAANWRIHPWAEGHGLIHIGGTMRPVQATPEFSPYYIEFEEDFGGYNFGGGNGQLDFKAMQIDWACG